MKTKLFFKSCLKTGAAFLFATALSAGFSACTDAEDNAVNPNPQETVMDVDYTEPTTDQMEVRVLSDMPAAVMGQFDDNSTAKALIARLPQTTSAVDFDTRVILLKGSDFEQGYPFDEEQMEQIIHAYSNGAYVLLERPTVLQFFVFTVAFLEAYVNYEEKCFAETFDLTPDEARAAIRNTQTVERMNARAANVRSLATRATIDDPTDVCAEMIGLSNTEFFYMDPFLEETSLMFQTEDQGILSEPVLQQVKTERNAYRSGLMADGIALWLNDVEQRRTETAAMARTRGGADNAINNLMSASETFTFNGPIYFKSTDNELLWGFNRVQMTIRSWGVHNFDTNKDFYYVQQNVSLNMGKKSNGNQMFWPTRGENYWYDAKNYGQWNYFYGNFLSKYETSMNLTGKGTILLEAATPETDNATTTTSVNIGQSSSETQTVGISWGGTFGVNGGKLTATVNVGGSYSCGVTNSTSFSVGSSKAYKDLRAVKNREGKKVTWTYIGNLPKFRIENRDGFYWYMHDTAPDILTNTADLTNEICWSVANPDGAYSLDITSYPTTAALFFHHEQGKPEKVEGNHYEYQGSDHSNSFSHDFLQPNRFLQTWNMSVTVDEYEGNQATGQGAALEQRIAEKFPSIFHQEITFADKTKESLEMANAYIKYAKGVFSGQMDILQDMAKDYGIRKFTIQWRKAGTKVKEDFSVLVPELIPDRGTDAGDGSYRNLFDCDYSTCWTATKANKADGVWFAECHTTKPVSPKGYTMVTYGPTNSGALNPYIWRIYGKKNVNDAWTELAYVRDLKHSHPNGLPRAPYADKTNSFDVPPVDMQYFRIEIVNSFNFDNMKLADFYFNY